MAKKKSNNNMSAWELNQQSIDYLGVSKQPFANEILTEESFFQYQALDKISDSLVHQVQFSELLLLIEGPKGAGKTAFFRQFIQLEIANTKTLAIQAEATDTLIQVQQKMSIHLQDLGDANHLDDNLKSLQMFDQTPLAVINNSHVLSDTTLQELLRYQQSLKQDQDISLKILLFANTGMSDTLQKVSDIQPEQLYVQNLPVFSPKQASAFITHRLRIAGYFGEILLDEDALTQLFKSCNGTPLDIMVQSAPLIDKAIVRILKPDTGGWKKYFIVTIVLTVITAGGYAAFMYLNNDSTHQLQDVNLEPENQIITQQAANDDDVIEILENDKIQNDMIQNDDLKTNTESFTTPDINASENIPDTSAPIIEPAKELAIETTAPDLTDNLTTDTATPANTVKEASVTLDPKPANIKTKITAPSITKPALNPTLLKLKEMGVHDASWLLQQDSQNWTMQLLGARDPKTLLKFAQVNHLSSNATWYKTWLKSSPYYVMIYGSYISRDAARDAIAGLPPKLRSLKPWVKSIAAVQKTLKQN